MQSCEVLTARLVLLVLLTATLVSGIEAKPVPGKVARKVTTMAGKPLANVPITVDGIGSGWTKKSLKTNVASAYSMNVPRNGLYRVTAETKMSLNGKTFTLSLHPAGNNANYLPGRKGVEKNFRLKLTGRKV
jgi:hypothetical protein